MKFYTTVNEAFNRPTVCCMKATVSTVIMPVAYHLLGNMLSMMDTNCILQQWDGSLFEALSKAGGSVYSNYAVGYNNVKVPDASKHGIAVGNTPGIYSKLQFEEAQLSGKSSIRPPQQHSHSLAKA